MYMVKVGGAYLEVEGLEKKDRRPLLAVDM